MTGRLEGVKVMIVDDDADVVEALETALTAEGAETVAVDNGNEAVIAVGEEKPAVVVLDMMLPGRSGFLVLEKIKGEADSPVVIMLTANEGRRHAAYAASLGVDKYFVKPAPLESLVSTCVQLLDEKKKEESASRRQK